MKTTKTKLVPLVGDKQKFYAPIFSSSATPMDVSLSIRATNDYIGNVSITLVYWENGQKIIIKDYLGSGASTPIDFTIQNPTSLPPFILYLDSDSPTAIDIEVEYDLPLNVGSVTPNDERIQSLEDTNLPLIVYNDAVFSQNTALVREKIKTPFSYAESMPSPLVLDLDGDGVETVGTDNGIYFDHNNNGFAEDSGWAGKDDGLFNHALAA